MLDCAERFSGCISSYGTIRLVQSLTRLQVTTVRVHGRICPRPLGHSRLFGRSMNYTVEVCELIKSLQFASEKIVVLKLSV